MNDYAQQKKKKKKNHRFISLSMEFEKEDHYIYFYGSWERTSFLSMEAQEIKSPWCNYEMIEGHLLTY